MGFERPFEGTSLTDARKTERVSERGGSAHLVSMPGWMSRCHVVLSVVQTSVTTLTAHNIHHMDAFSPL